MNSYVILLAVARKISGSIPPDCLLDPARIASYTDGVNLRKLISLAASLFLFCGAAHGAELRLAEIFGDHMVLQSGKPIRIWGKAAPGKPVEVAFGGSRGMAVTDGSGRWEMVLPAQTAAKAGRPLVIRSGAEQIALDDVVVGEVWLCGGQSNMVRQLSMTTNGTAEAGAATQPLLRVFTVRQNLGKQPAQDVEGTWTVCTPEIAGEFSAVAYYFGKDLISALDVPVGLVVSAVGGTPAEAWMPRSAIAAAGETLPHALDRYEASEKVTEEEAADASRSLARWKASRAAVEDPAPGLAQRWHEAGVEAEGWKEVSLPASWERVQPQAVDGSVWFRRTFEAGANAGVLYLSLGITRNRPKVWLNGRELPGADGFQGGTRTVFKIGPDELKAGANTLAVRLIIAGGKGGIQPSDRPLGVYPESLPHKPSIALDGTWLCRVEQPLPVERTPEPSVWEDKTTPGILWNGMIAPLVPFSLRGAIWYQGEANVPRAREYEVLFPALIRSWREAWHDDRLPFLFVQLAGYLKPAAEPGESAWAQLRQAQTRALDLPATAMAVAFDEGDPHDIHPRNKRPVGQRLARAALGLVYGKIPAAEAYSPRLDGVTREGGRVRIRFVPSVPLATRDGKPVDGIAISGPDGKYSWATAIVEGADLLVDAPTGTRWIRYAWANSPRANLQSPAGLPVAPFFHELPP